MLNVPEGFTKFLEREISMEQTAEGIWGAIVKSVSERHSTLEEPMIREDHPYFHTMNRMGMIEISREKGRRLLGNHPTRGPFYCYLSKKAINIHKKFIEAEAFGENYRRSR